MAFFAGIVVSGRERRPADLGDRLGRIALTHGGGGKPSLWHAADTAFVYVPRPFTPQDRLDRFPAAFAGGSSRLVFDGRFDNRDDLVASLGLDVPHAASLGDGALLMMALERWGTGALPRLIGAFSFAWWDEKACRLVLAVDATGGRTLYAHAAGGRLYFSTRPLAILGFPDVDRQVDEEAVAHLLLGRPMPAGLTPFKGVFRLPPAGCLVWRNGEYSVKRYWQPDLERRIRYRDHRDYIGAARELLDRVVGASLRAESPVGCQLSGGLDSSAVVSTAAKLAAPNRIHTFTNYPDPAVRLPAERPRAIYNEVPLAQATAGLYPNIDAHYLPSGDITDGEADPARLFWEFGMPLRNYTNFGAWMPLHDRAKELGISVLLSGSTGNFTLSWKSEALLADLAASGRFIDLARQLRGLRRHGEHPWALLKKNVIRFMVPIGLRSSWYRLRGRDQAWRELCMATDNLAASLDAPRLTDQNRIATDTPDRDRRVRLLGLERNWATSQWLAGYPYALGCDLRDPLGDRRMVEFCLALPPEIWQTDGRPRSFAREVLADRLPGEVVNAIPRGYQNADWFHRLSLLRPSFMEQLDRLEASPTVRHMLDLPRIRTIAEDWPADADAAQARVSDLLHIYGRGIHYGRFIRWIEGANG